MSYFVGNDFDMLQEIIYPVLVMAWTVDVCVLDSIRFEGVITYLASNSSQAYY